jgi:hypothetical protein
MESSVCVKKKNDYGTEEEARDLLSAVRTIVKKIYGIYGWRLVSFLVSRDWDFLYRLDLREYS